MTQQQLTQVTNNGKSHYLPQSAIGKSVTLFYRGQESWTKIEHQGDCSIKITHDGRVMIGSYVSSDAHDLTDLAQRLLAIDVQLVVDDPRERAEHLPENPRWQQVMAMAGYGRKASEYEQDEDAGLVFFICLGKRHPDVPPHFLKEVRDVAALMIEDALNWAEDNLQTATIRALELESHPFRAVHIHQLMTSGDWSIIRVKVGEAAEVPWQGSSYFGSGGAWGNVSGYGEYSKVEGGTNKDNGFVRSGTEMFLFDKGPAIVFTSAGDDINGGRTFYRKIYIAE